MIKLENIDVYGWEAAIRGMRNPMNSWDKSDTDFEFIDCEMCPYFGKPDLCDTLHCLALGKSDLKLMKNLANAGDDHGKFLRMINVTMDITCHHAFWAEFDTYKVGTVRNSCSKMHKIHVKPFEVQDFSHEGCDMIQYATETFRDVIATCEQLRQDFNRTQDKSYWRALIELLPMGYNIKATVQLNYQVLKHMYHARKNHKLVEWRIFCNLIKSLPYAAELITGEES